MDTQGFLITLAVNFVAVMAMALLGNYLGYRNGWREGYRRRAFDQAQSVTRDQLKGARVTACPHCASTLVVTDDDGPAPGGNGRPVASSEHFRPA